MPNPIEKLEHARAVASFAPAKDLGEETKFTCPKCRAIIGYTVGYGPWCRTCDWNLDGPEAETEETGFAKIYRTAGMRLGRRILDDLTRQAGRDRSVVGFGFLALAYAALIHFVTATLGLLVVFFVVTFWPNMVLMSPAILFGLLVFILLPRPGQLPKRGVLAPAEAPVLYSVVARVARACVANPPDAIAVNAMFNASMSTYGWRRRHLLTIGLPLWSVFDCGERIALLGHEIGHTKFNDTGRSSFVWAALGSLMAWYDAFSIHDGWMTREAFGPIADLSRIFLAGCAKLAYWNAYVLVHLIYQDSQRAEFRADALSVAVAGRAAAIGSERKVGWMSVVLFAHSMIVNRNSTRNLFDEIEVQRGQVPATELDRLDRLITKGVARLDATHPPASHRLEFMSSLPEPVATVAVGAEEWKAISQELAPSRLRIHAWIFDGS